MDSDDSEDSSPKMLESLPDRPLKPEEIDALTNVSGIDRSTGCAGTGMGDTGVVIAGETFALGLAYVDK